MGKGVPWARRVQLSLQPRHPLPLPPCAMHPPPFPLGLFCKACCFAAPKISDTRLAFSVVHFDSQQNRFIKINNLDKFEGKFIS